MKLRLPQRMSQRTGWIIVACLAAPLVLIFMSPFGYIGLSMYWQWHQGYGFACESKTLAEAESPSRQWIAKARIVTCSGLADGQWIEAVLVPNAIVPFLVQYERVFVDDITSRREAPPGNRLAPHWIDDHSLELRDLPCEPCQEKDSGKPCDSECRMLNDVNGIAVSFQATGK